VPVTGNDIRLYTKDNQKKFGELPLCILDGIPTYNAAYVMSLNPTDIETIGVISSYENIDEFRSLGENGILVINSKTGRAFDSMPDDNTFVMYKGFSMITEYYTPKYDLKEVSQSRIPDLRPLLYWNSNIITNSNNSSEIEFYTSDQTGTFEIVVEGVGENGDLLHSTTTFEVQ
jgi:hypothetical protein